MPELQAFHNYVMATHFLTGMRVVFVVTLIFPMLTFGAVELEPLAMNTLVTSVSLVLLCWRPIRQRRIAFIAGIALVCILTLGAGEYAQSLRFAGNPIEHPAWEYVRTLVGSVDGAVSVIPEQTRADIIAWSPVLTFILALHLFNRRTEAFLLIRILSHLVMGVAVISLVQFFFTPMIVGFETKTAYVGSLTGFYINRNSAGTFFGIGIVITVGLMAFHLRNSRPSEVFRKTLTPDRLTGSERAALYLSVGMMMEIFALAATQSRGATVATFVALVYLTWIFSRGGRSVNQTRIRWARFAIVSGLISIISVIVAQEAIYRFNAQSVDQARLCTYASTWQAVRDNWPWGAGFGSFAAVFPAYRSPQCSGIEGIWDAAHNSYLEGALGLGAWFVVVVVVAYAALGWAFTVGLRERRSHRFAPAIGIAALLLAGLHSLIDFSLQIPGNALFLAALLAACVTISFEGMKGSSAKRPIQERHRVKIRNAGLNSAHAAPVQDLDGSLGQAGPALHHSRRSRKPVRKGLH